MYVCVDCSPLLIRCAGVKSYLYYLARNLKAYAGPHKFSTFPFLDQLGGADLLDGSRPLDHEQSMIGRYATTARLAFVNMANAGHHQMLDWLTPGIDLFHATNHVRNPPRNKKLTTTLHDLTTWTVPHCHPQSHIDMEKSFVERVVLRSDAVIAISESTKQDLIRLFDFPPERIEVIHPGIAGAYFETKPGQTSAVREKYGLSGNYIVHVGTVEPRKNLDTLLDAYQQISPSLREEFPLLLIGPMGWAAESTRNRVRSSGPGVRYLGYVRSRGRLAATHRRSHRLCISVSLRRIRSAHTAGHGARGPRADLECFVNAGGRRRRRRSGRPAQHRGNSRRDRAAHAESVAARTTLGEGLETGPGISLGDVGQEDLAVF